MTFAEIVKMLEAILPLIQAALPPTEYEKIVKAIEEFRKHREESRALFKKAVLEMDVPSLNKLSDSMFE